MIRLFSETKSPLLQLFKVNMRQETGMNWKSLINSLLLLSSMQSSVMIVSGHMGKALYRMEAVSAQWWEGAKIPNATFEGSSLISCAGKCRNHDECDMFSIQLQDSLCHLGSSRSSTTKPTSGVQDSGLQTKVYSQNTERCVHVEGTS